MGKFLDMVIEWLKWPVAVLSILSIPAFIQSYSYFNFTNIKFLVLAGGFFFFYIARTVADNSIKVTMQILAHELTHAFFAFITFHKIYGIKIAEDISGGKMSFKGRGNWLIIIAPYFFPLMSFIFVIFVSVYGYFFHINNTLSLIINGFMGYFLAYHSDTVLSQIHEKQTDFPKVGYPFCFTFIPGANFWSVGCILAFNSLGWKGIATYNFLIWKLNMNNLALILSF